MANLTRSKHPDFDKCADKELAFEHDGVSYYQFTKNGTPIYQERFVVFGMILQKHQEFKLTDATLSEHELIGQETCKLLLGELYAAESGIKALDLGRIQEAVELLKDNFDMLRVRRKLNFFPEFHYELATLWYFDESESPFVYDEGYNLEKKARWLNSENREQLFFWLLRQPLSGFLHLEDLLPTTMLTYTTQVAMRELLRSTILLNKAMQLGLSDGMLKSIELQTETWEQYANLNPSLLRNTIISSATE